VVVQDDSFDSTNSVTICVFTTDPPEAPLFRVLIEPTESNGLHAPSRLMVDKLTSVTRSKLGERVGRLAEQDIIRLNQALLVFLGLAVSPRAAR
jgi:mRNA interferase MazF